MEEIIELINGFLMLLIGLLGTLLTVGILVIMVVFTYKLFLEVLL